MMLCLGSCRVMDPWLSLLQPPGQFQNVQEKTPFGVEKRNFSTPTASDNEIRLSINEGSTAPATIPEMPGLPGFGGDVGIPPGFLTPRAYHFNSVVVDWKLSRIE